MTEKQLAVELRQRQYDANLINRESVDLMSDSELINCYITCSCCKEKQVNEEQLIDAIESADNAEHFIHICGKFAESKNNGSNGKCCIGNKKNNLRAKFRRRNFP